MAPLGPSVSDRSGIEDLLREAAPRVLAAVVRRYGDFADAEDAVQEATARGRHPVAGSRAPRRTRSAG